jgi:hypothetical protein
MVRDMTAHPRLNSIDTIRQLNAVARRYYHNENGEFNHESYIRDCFECLLSFFSTELFVGEGAGRENAYLFAALTYKREDSPKIELVKITDGFGYYFADDVEQDLANSFNRVIDELYQSIDNEQSMSVTKALLKDKKRGKDLFLYSGEPYEQPVEPGNPDVDARIAFFPLKDLTFDPTDSSEHFCKINKEPIKDFREKLDQNAEIEMKLTESDQQIGVLLWHYKRLEKEYSVRRPGEEFLVHFIRPSFIDFGHNILLSLGTSRRLEADQLSMIYLLVYRIVSQTVIEKTKEVERFKRRASFSLTTHALKTELQISIKPKVNNIKKEIEKLSLPANSILSKVVTELEAQYADLFCMTAFISLIDKIESQSHFEESGRMEGLLVEHQETINILKYCAEYNKTNPHLDGIKVLGGIPRPLSIKVYNSYFSTPALRLFLDTIFENVNKFGRRTDKKIELRVSSLASEWTFENDTNDERVEIDLKKIRGNLFLFNLLIEKTNSGKLTISPPGDYKFKVTYQMY